MTFQKAQNILNSLNVFLVINANFHDPIMQEDIMYAYGLSKCQDPLHVLGKICIVFEKRDHLLFKEHNCNFETIKQIEELKNKLLRAFHH